jgi:hypothetical protein
MVAGGASDGTETVTCALPLAPGASVPSSGVMVLKRAASPAICSSARTGSRPRLAIRTSSITEPPGTTAASAGPIASWSLAAGSISVICVG